MKTGVTVINVVQVGMEEYRDVRSTMIFEDDSTLGEIKEWIKKETKVTKVETKDISLSAAVFSDYNDQS